MGTWQDKSVVYLFVCLCLSGLIQLIIRKHVKVISIDGLLALLTAFLKQTCYSIISCIFLWILFVENKFFFFFFFAASFQHFNGTGSVYVCVRKSTE